MGDSRVSAKEATVAVAARLRKRETCGVRRIGKTSLPFKARGLFVFVCVLSEALGIPRAVPIYA